jgi:hypothetical protein
MTYLFEQSFNQIYIATLFWLFDLLASKLFEIILVCQYFESSVPDDYSSSRNSTIVLMIVPRKACQSEFPRQDVDQTHDANLGCWRAGVSLPFAFFRSKEKAPQSTFLAANILNRAYLMIIPVPETQLGFSVSCGYISASFFSLGVQITSGRAPAL